MTNGELKHYEVRWWHGEKMYRVKIFSLLWEARSYQEQILHLWASPGDKVEVVELSSFTTRTISQVVKTATSTQAET